MNKNAKLLWNEEGRIECEAHAPYAGSDSRVLERWRVMTTNERIDFAAEIGRDAQCGTCAAIARNQKAVVS